MEDAAQAAQPDRYVDKAVMLIQVNRDEDALKLLAQHPDDPEAAMWSAVALQSLKRLAQALAEIERSIGMRPDTSFAHAIRSDILRELERTKPSLEAAREAVRLDSEDPIALISLARAAAKAKRWREAERAAAEAVRIAPGVSEARGAVGFVELEHGRRRKATAHLREAVAMDPQDPTLLNNLAIAGSRFRSRVESVRMLESAVRLDPTNPLLVDNLYLKTSELAGGRGYDRLDLMLYAPFAVLMLLDAAIFLGWVHPPALVTAAALALTLMMVVVISVADYMRNRRRMKATAPSTQQLYRRRFLWDHFMQTAYFVITFGVPGLVIVTIDAAFSHPNLLWLLSAFAWMVVWYFTALPFWYSHVRGWVASKR
jgi:tetratricopeptide (TPR) repeat protein